jgi:hypothetical protein
LTRIIFVRIWRLAQPQQNEDVSSEICCSILWSGETKWQVNTWQISSSSDFDIEYLHLHDLHDPEHRYSGLVQLGDIKVDSPDVRNKHGILLDVRDLRTNLHNSDVVEVELILKLYVCSFYVLKFLWQLLPVGTSDCPSRLCNPTSVVMLMLMAPVHTNSYCGCYKLG